MKNLFAVLTLLLSSALISACQTKTISASDVPLPTEMSANIDVKGRLSKLINMDIKYVGKTIPYTYSHNKITNSPGYDWWVSKHFAIKSDLPEHKVKLYLELLELSYPHYVSLFGAEPANIDNQRIAVVYGSSRDSTKESMFDDGFTRGVHKNAGGETMFYNRAGYSFPSHREQHQRYIVIHETMHAYHMALTAHSTWAPNWITEGLADSIASHVYYPETNELAVMVFDRAPMNYILSGLKQYVKGGQPSIEQINNNPALKRGLNFFIVHFLLSDPERAFYFSLLRDRLMAANPHSEATLPTANKLLKDTFVNWQQLEQDFAAYVSNIQASYLIAQGPWEQNGDAYWIRGHKNNYVPRLDIRTNAKTNNTAAKFDFPQPAASSLVNSAASNFKAGLLVNFVPEQIARGQVGLALGLQYHQDNVDYFSSYENKYDANKDSYLNIALHLGRKLVISGQNLTFERQAYALTPEMTQAIKQQLQLGVSALINNQSLTLELAAGSQKQTINIMLSSAEVAQLTTGDIALLAANTRHKLVPYFKQQPSRADYLSQPDHKQWTSNGQLYRIFKTCQNFNLACEDEVLSTIAKLSNNNEAQLANEVQALLQSTISLANNNADALLSLSGAKLTLLSNMDDMKLEVALPANTQMNIDNQISWQHQQQTIETLNQLKVFNSGTEQLHIRDNTAANTLEVNSVLQWQGQTFEIKQTTDKRQFDGVYLTPSITREGDLLTVSAKITGPYSGNTSGTIDFELLPNLNAKLAKFSQPASIAPYETKTWQQSFKLTQIPSQNLAVEITATLEVDGEGVQLSELIYVK